MQVAFSQVQNANLRDLVVEQVRTAIIEGHLGPGDRIVESKLTDQLGVSRTPVREALILLEREGLVQAVRNRGFFVRRFTTDDVTEIFAMRSALECFAADLVYDQVGAADILALRNLIVDQREYIAAGDHKGTRTTDMRFHQYLVEKAGNSHLTRSWQELVAQVAALLYLRAEANHGFNENIAVDDHERILLALELGDVDGVKAEHHRINDRVAAECRQALKELADRKNRVQRAQSA